MDIIGKAKGSKGGNPQDDYRFDDAGKELIKHFLIGEGKGFIKNNDSFWNDYLNNNSIIQREIREAFSDSLQNQIKECSGQYPDEVSFLKQTQLTITEYGGWFTSGYSLINGTNSYLLDGTPAGYGGFTTYGIGEKQSEIKYKVNYDFILQDIFDFNFDYFADIVYTIGSSIYGATNPNIEMNEYQIKIAAKGSLIY